MSYWLFKSEPSCFSIDDLKKEPQQTACWDGVRNYQARNMMRDDMQKGELGFFYHSNAKPAGIVGIIEIASAAYPDHTAFDPYSEHPDPKSDPNKPRWYMVDVRLKHKFPTIIALNDLREQKALSDMQLLRKGNRLSIMPVSQQHWHYVIKLSERTS